MKIITGVDMQNNGIGDFAGVRFNRLHGNNGPRLYEDW